MTAKEPNKTQRRTSRATEISIFLIIRSSSLLCRLDQKIGFKSGQKWDEEGEKEEMGTNDAKLWCVFFHIVLYVPVSHISIFLPFPHKGKRFV